MAEEDVQRLRLQLQVFGAVQGVGFRPFVYRLATQLGLTGWVLNDARGVLLEAEGERLLLEELVRRVEERPPPRARIDRIQTSWNELRGFTSFEIRDSAGSDARSVLVLPDVATCDACLAEARSPSDRRYLYPLTNCTNCGPRFSIIEALPYDRPSTTMARFQMCEACRAEYADPFDRRFHAQPNACPTCGPQVAFWSAAGESLEHGGAAIEAAARALRNGRIVALKGVGGYQLLVKASDEVAVCRLRERKDRPAKPFAVMAADLDSARRLCRVADEDAAALTGPEAPILLMPRLSDAPLARSLAPDVKTVGVMLPATVLHHLLVDLVGEPLVATSGNLSDEPICIDEQEALRRLGRIADFLLVHDRPIVRHVDDSVAWTICGELRLLRRARGFAPLPITVPGPLPGLLAAGAQLKNTVAVSVGEHVFVSQHIGDLETLEAQIAFERAATDLLTLYEVRPVAVAHDLHPDYVSTQWAQRSVAGDIAALTDLPLVAVQHHHAHLAACLADNGCAERALGFTWDGTGYGTDGTIWGGEALLGDAAGFERVASLLPFALPGGDAAVLEPRRTAAALLWEALGPDALERDDLPPVAAMSAVERRIIGEMLESGTRAPVTTSAGRLFDGVAALTGLYPLASYEGQAAIAFEAVADPMVSDAYPLPLVDELGRPPLRFDWRELVVAVLDDLKAGRDRGLIAARFHNALCDGIVAVARRVSQTPVALTGGCFQNRLLTERATGKLESAGFRVLLHRDLPPNDGGIAVGQLLVAAAQFDLHA